MKEKISIIKLSLVVVLCIMFTSYVVPQASSYFARVHGNFLTISDSSINLKIAAPLSLGEGRQRLYDDQGRLRGYQAYDSKTQVGIVTLVYSPLANYTSRTRVQALVAEENRMLPLLQAIYSLKSDEIVRTVRTWNGYSARIGRYSASSLDSNAVYVNDVTAAVAGVVVPSLAFNTYLTTPSSRLGNTFYIRTMFELRDFGNQSRNGTRTPNNATADVVFTVAVIPGSMYNNSVARYEWRDYTDSSAIAQYKDVVQNDTMNLGCAKDPAIDIVLIVDNSYSMEDHQTATVNAATVLRSSLANAGYDNFRIGLLTSSFYNQACWPLANKQCDNTASTACRPFVAGKGRLDALGQWLTPNTSSWIGAGTTSCQTGTEKALLSLQEITSGNSLHANFVPLTPDLAQGLTNPQKLRQGSNLVFIFVGDADDQSYGSGIPDSKGTCQQGIEYYTNYLRQFRDSNRFASMTLGGILCPLGVPCGETQCNPRIIRSVINRFSGFIGDINSKSDVAAGMQQIMRDVLSAASCYKLRYRAISTSINVTYPRQRMTVGPCPLQVPRSQNNGFDYDVQRNSIVFYGSCRPVNVTGGASNSSVIVRYSYWSPDANCSQYRNQLDCNPAQCNWCPTQGTTNSTTINRRGGVCVTKNAPCPAAVVMGPGVYGGYGQGANGGYTIGGKGIPWWAILLLILFLCCLCLLCLLLLLLLFLLFKPGPKSGVARNNKYEMVENPGSKSGSYTPPADDFGAAPYAAGSGTAGSGYAGDDPYGASSSGGGGGPYDDTPEGNPVSGGGAPSSGVAGSGNSNNNKPLKGGGRPMTLDAGVTPNDQGDPNVKPDDNKYILFGGVPRWPG